MNTKILTGILLVSFVIIGYLYTEVYNASDSLTREKSFDVTLQNQAYVPDTITVNVGDVVTFNIDNRDDEQHGLHLAEFGVTESIPPLSQVQVTFVADRVLTTATTCAADHPEKINVVVREV